MIRSRFQGMYWSAHKTSTLTSFQRTVYGPRQSKTGKFCQLFVAILKNMNYRIISTIKKKLIRKDIRDYLEHFIFRQRFIFMI